MATKGVCSPAKPSKLMGTGEDKKPVKPSKPIVSTQGRAIALKTDWLATMQMQANDNARPIPPPFSTPNYAAASSSTPHPYVLGNQNPLVGSYATPPQYPVSCHPGGLHYHLNNGLTFRIPEAEGIVSNRKDRESARKRAGSLESVGGRSGESGKRKTTGSSETDHSGSGIACPSYTSEKAIEEERRVMKKRSLDISGCTEANARNNNASGVSKAKATAIMVARKIQFLSSLLERRELEARAEAVKCETSMLAKNLVRYSEKCEELRRENDFLLRELEQTYEPDVFSALKAKDPYHVCQPDYQENNGDNQESKSEHKSSSFTDMSNSDRMVGAGSN